MLVARMERSEIRDGPSTFRSAPCGLQTICNRGHPAVLAEALADLRVFACASAATRIASRGAVNIASAPDPGAAGPPQKPDTSAAMPPRRRELALWAKGDI